MAPIYIHIYIYISSNIPLILVLLQESCPIVWFVYIQHLELLNLWRKTGGNFFSPRREKSGSKIHKQSPPPLNTGPVLVQLCVGAEGIAGSARPRRPARAHLAPVHHRDPARRLPRPKARVRQAGVPDVRQAASDRHPAPHPRPPRCPWQVGLVWLRVSWFSLVW